MGIDEWKKPEISSEAFDFIDFLKTLKEEDTFLVDKLISLLNQVVDFYNEVEEEVDIYYEDEYADAIDFINDMIGTIIEVFKVFKMRKLLNLLKR